MGVQSLPILAFKTLGSISLLREVGIGYQWHQSLRWAAPTVSYFGLVSRNTPYRPSAPSCMCLPGTRELRYHPKVGEKSENIRDLSSVQNRLLYTDRESKAPVQPLSKMARSVRKAGVRSTRKPCLGRGFPPSLSNEWCCFWHWSTFQLVFSGPRPPPLIVSGKWTLAGTEEERVGSGRSGAF